MSAVVVNPPPVQVVWLKNIQRMAFQKRCHRSPV